MVGWDVAGVLVACAAGVGMEIRFRAGRWAADAPRLAMGRATESGTCGWN